MPNESREFTHKHAHICAATLDHTSYLPSYEEWIPLCQEISYLANIHKILHINKMLTAGEALRVPIVHNPDLGDLWQTPGTVRIPKPRHVVTIRKGETDAKR